MANMTEMRQNTTKVMSRIIETKEPAVILQRSKPVAYIVEASVYEEMQKKLQEAEKINRTVSTKNALQELAGLREKMAGKGRQKDSTGYIRDIREGKRDE